MGIRIPLVLTVGAIVVAGGCTPAADTPGPAADGSAGGTAIAMEDRVTAEGPFGFGTPASEEEIARWDIDVGPDGEGLPAGSGTVDEGAEVWAADCARCHGESGVEGPYGVLVATEGVEDFPFGATGGTTSIGNYWPYATTVFDYVRRSMPFETPGSLTDSEVYAVTAWLLWRNELLAADVTLDAEALMAVEMPAREHFVPSDDVPLTTLP